MRLLTDRRVGTKIMIAVGLVAAFGTGDGLYAMSSLGATRVLPNYAAVGVSKAGTPVVKDTARRPCMLPENSSAPASNRPGPQAISSR